MKIVLKVAVCMIFLMLAGQVNAQDLGGLMTELADGIKPEAFKGKWDKNKDGWMDAAKKLGGSNDLGAAGTQLTGLLNNLKGSAFSSDAKGLKSSLLKNMLNLDDPKKLVDSITSLVNGLNPSMLKSGFDKASFLSKLGGLL